MKNMRKLNKKGFTLVELLAVVVILALVMGIAASSMLSTMNSSRKSTLHSAAQTAATNLNNWVADDMLATSEDDRKLGNDFISDTQTGKWICLSDSTTIANKNVSGTTLISALGLNKEDVVINTSEKTYANPYDETTAKYTINDNATCSAIRYNKTTGGYEVLLVATSGGKYFVASDAGKNYAFSRASKSGETITN